MQNANDSAEPTEPVRLDSWLWAARFFKTRSLARQAVDGGKVEVNGERSKPSRMIQPGTQLTVRKADDTFEVTVVALAKRRGPAKLARSLFTESPESVERREARRSEARMLRLGLSAPARKPDKRERRARANLRDLDGSADAAD